MIQNTNYKYDLEERTYNFAKDVRAFIKLLPRNISNNEDCKQLARSSGSISANYIEANESLSRKDFVMRVKISKKETKESRLWLNLLDVGENIELEKIKKRLMGECSELMKIFGAIVEKSK